MYICGSQTRALAQKELHGPARDPGPQLFLGQGPGLGPKYAHVSYFPWVKLPDQANILPGRMESTI